MGLFGKSKEEKKEEVLILLDGLIEKYEDCLDDYVPDLIPNPFIRNPRTGLLPPKLNPEEIRREFEVLIDVLLGDFFLIKKPLED